MADFNENLCANCGLPMDVCSAVAGSMQDMFRDLRDLGVPGELARTAMAEGMKAARQALGNSNPGVLREREERQAHLQRTQGER